MYRGLMTGLLLGALVISGCQSARYVARDNETGVIALPVSSAGGLSQARKTAKKMMVSHFPDGYEVIKEEEIVLGEVTAPELPSAVAAEPETVIRPVSASREARTTGKTEYRIHYRRTGD